LVLFGAAVGISSAAGPVLLPGIKYSIVAVPGSVNQVYLANYNVANGTFANGIGGSVTFPDVALVVSDTITHKFPIVGEPVTFKVAKSVPSFNNTGAFKCNPPPPTVTNSIGGFFFHGATASGWIGQCVFEADTPDAGSIQIAETVALPVADILKLPMPDTSQFLSYFTQPGNISIFADVLGYGQGGWACDSTFFHCSCPDASGDSNSANGAAVPSRINIGVKWPPNWPSDQTPIRLTYTWNTFGASGASVDPMTQDWILYPANNGKPIGFTGFITGITLHTPKISAGQEGYFQVAITAIDGKPLATPIKQNTMTGKTGVVITYECLGKWISNGASGAENAVFSALGASHAGQVFQGTTLKSDANGGGDTRYT
jgi:hypothetical protein